jgi:tetratricopeptide (TPR) repeat protein
MEGAAMRRHWLFVFSFAALVWLYSPLLAHADILVLTSGERRTGIVEDAPGQPDFLVLKSAGLAMHIPRDRVKEIIRESKGTTLLQMGRMQYDKGQFEEALEYFKQARDAEPDLKEATAWIAETEKELERRASDERRAQIEKIASNLRGARDASDAEEFEKANELLAEAESLKPTVTQSDEIQNIRISLLMSWAADRKDKLDKIGAAEKYQAVLKLAPKHIQATNELIDVWINDVGKTAEVRALLESKIGDDMNDMVTLSQLANLAYREQQYAKALPMYLKLYDSGDYRDTSVSARLQTILENLRDEASSNGRLEEAIGYHKQLMEQFPDTSSRPLDFYEYNLRLGKIGGGDAQGYLELAEWAKTKDLEKNAKDLYSRVLDIDPENEAARAAIDAYAKAKLDEAVQIFHEGRYLMAQLWFDDLLKEYPKASDAIQKLAWDWSEKAKIKLINLNKENEEHAKDLIKSGDNYYDRALSEMSKLTASRDIYEPNPNYGNPRTEAAKYFRWAIKAYQQATYLGPSLPAVTRGELRTKQNDAEQKLQQMENPTGNYKLPRLDSSRRTF